MALDSLVKDADLIGRLQAGGGEVVSAEQGYRLYEIAQGKSTIEEFLHDFGHRAVYEADLLNPRRAGGPSWVLEQVGGVREDTPARGLRGGSAQPALGGGPVVDSRAGGVDPREPARARPARVRNRSAPASGAGIEAALRLANALATLAGTQVAGRRGCPRGHQVRPG